MAGVETDAAQAALDLVGRDPRAALAAADAVVAALPRPRTADEVRALAVAQRAAALSLRSTGDPGAAERRLRRALAVADRAGQPDVAAEVRMTLAFVLLDLGKYRTALGATDHALSVLRGVKAARVRTIRALVLHREARFREAFAEYEAALAVLRRARDRAWEARLRHNRALLSMELGDTAGALADLEWTRAFDLAQGNATDAADALFNMGVALGCAGDIPAALAAVDAAEREWGSSVERPERWITRADAYLDVGLVVEATANAREAVDWLRGRDWEALEAHARLLLATCLLSGRPPDLEGARAEAATARAAFLREDRREAVAQADYILLKAALLGTPDRALLDAAGEAATRLRDLGGDARSADLRITAGAAALDLGEPDRGRRLLGPLSAMDRAPQLDVRSRAWFARALLAELDGDRAAAGSALVTAWRTLERQRSLLGATELRASAAAHASAVVGMGTRLALDDRSPAAAFEWAERGRATVLRYRTASRPRDPELAQALARLRWETRAAEGGDEPTPRQRLARSEADVLRLTRQAVGDSAAVAPVTARSLQRLLVGETYVQFVGDRGSTWAVVARAGRRPRLVEVGPSDQLRRDVDTVVFGLRRMLVGFGSGTSRAAALAVVDQALCDLDSALRPALEGAGPELVVCPSKELTALPWSALGSCRDLTVSVAPSATSWTTARADGRAPHGPAPRAVSVAGPGLSGAAAEAADIAGLYADATLLAGADATVAALLAAARGADVLHVAAHGRLRADNPLFSTVELCDGPLTGYDLEGAGRIPPTVVLSACSSGAGRTTVADETLGLAWTLMALGAATVIGPLLPVPDEETRTLMVGVHRAVSSGLPASAALAQAQRESSDDPVARVVAASFVAYGV